MSDFQYKTKELIPAGSPEIEFKFLDYSMPLSGFSDFKNPQFITIQIVGSQCNQIFYKDELQLLLCHELGHVIGGAPYMTFIGAPKDLHISAEGQADYFATRVCLPHLFLKNIKSPDPEITKKDPSIENICSKENDHYDICERIIEASLNFTLFIHEQVLYQSNHFPPKNIGSSPDLLKKDPLIAKETLTREYPSSQCRLDTMIAGYLKEKRPPCWYKE